MRQGALGASSSGTHPPTHGAASGQTWGQTVSGAGVSHDQEGPPLSLAGRRSRWVQPRLVQGRCDQAAAKKFFRKLLTGLTSVPRGIITDQLKSDSAGKREVSPSLEHRQHRYLNNRAEHSPQPTRQREWRMPQVNSPGHAQRLLAACGLMAQPCRLRRHRLAAPVYRHRMSQRF
jgi:hypothetical protein